MQHLLVAKIFIQNFSLLEAQASFCLGLDGYFAQIPGLASYTAQE